MCLRVEEIINPINRKIIQHARRHKGLKRKHNIVHKSEHSTETRGRGIVLNKTGIKNGT